MGSKQGVLAISAATAIGQLVSFLALPALARLYSPAEFGVLALVLSVVAICLPIALLQLDGALLLPSTNDEAKPLIWLALLGISSVSIIVGLLLWLGRGMRALGLDAFPLIEIWIPVTLFSSAVVVVQNQLLLRGRRYGLSAGRILTQSVAATAIQVGLGLTVVATLGSNGLLLGTIAGAVLAWLLLIKSSIPYLGRVRLAELRAALKKYRQFPLIFAPSTLLTMACYQAPLLFATFWFGVSVGGQVGMAERIVAVPLAFLGLSLGKVLESELSHNIRSRTGGYNRVYLRISGYLAVIGVIVALVVGFAGPTVISLLLGSEWKVAGLAAQAMAVTAAVRMVVNPTRNFLSLFQKGRATLLLESTRLLLIGLAVSWIISSHASLVPSLWVMYLALTVADIMIWVYGAFVTRAESRRLI
jgi:O-antigen/teichoic acid export membrane protein